MAENFGPPRLIADDQVYSTKRPLTLSQLERLYALTDWRFVLLQREIELRYGSDIAKAVAVVKALALRYLVELPNEMSIVRRLSEDASLRLLCQYPVRRKATETAIRSVMFRFRDGFSLENLEDISFKSLISLVLSGRRPNMELPYVVPVDPEIEDPKGIPIEIRLDPYRPPVYLWTFPGTAYPPEIRTGIPMQELFLLMKQWEIPERKRAPGELPLPAVAKTEMQSGEWIRFRIERPPWFDPGYPIGGKDTASSLGPTVLREYSACHVIVLREGLLGREVLLSKRLSGYGSGKFTLPGGKKAANESFENCTRRELLEETGLRVVESRPVSQYLHRMPDKPSVFTVGALAEAYEGRLMHKEPSQNTAWSWYPLSDLPWPLFEPSAVALRHFLEDRFPDLTWTDIEAPMPVNNESALDVSNQRSFFEAGLLDS